MNEGKGIIKIHDSALDFLLETIIGKFHTSFSCIYVSLEIP
jgi:hypothetical protein